MATIESKSVPPQTTLASCSDQGWSDLPCPVDNPDADVVIYDGNCIFCISQVTKLMRWDGKNRLAFVSLHDEFVARQFPDLSYDQMMEQLYLVPKPVGQDGYSAERLGGADAIRYLTTRLPKLWFAAPLMHIPLTMPIWRWGYRQVAKRRYRIAGKKNGSDSGAQCDENGACELHFKD